MSERCPNGLPITAGESSVPWPSQLRNVRLFVFDFGGVLRDNSVSINEGLRTGFEAQGFPYPFRVEEVWRLRGVGKFDVAIECIKVQLALTVRGETGRLRSIIENPDAETILEALVADSLNAELLDTAERIRLGYKAFTDSPDIGHLIKIFPYVETALDRLSRKGYLVALLTNGSRATIRRDLSFPEKFDAVVSENDVASKKPSGEGLRHIMRLLRCAPDETAFVVDAGNDVLAGRDAGVACIGVLAGMGTRKTLSRFGLAPILDDVDQLSRIAPDRTAGQRWLGAING